MSDKLTDKKFAFVSEGSVFLVVSVPLQFHTYLSVVDGFNGNPIVLQNAENPIPDTGWVIDDTSIPSSERYPINADAEVQNFYLVSNDKTFAKIIVSTMHPNFETIVFALSNNPQIIDSTATPDVMPGWTFDGTSFLSPE